MHTDVRRRTTQAFTALAASACFLFTLIAIVAGNVSAESEVALSRAATCDTSQQIADANIACPVPMPGDGKAAATTPALPVYPRYAHAVAGAGGGLATVLLLHPLDTLKTRLQSDAASRRSGALQVLRGILATDGPIALYRGAVPAVIGSVSSWAFYMHWFHSARSVISSHVTGRPSPLTDFLAGTSAGMLTAVATNPIWVVKVRLQLQQQQQRQGMMTVAKSVATTATTASKAVAERAHPPHVFYSGFLHGMQCIVRDEGVRGLYKGLGPSLWLVSHGAIQFTLYEQFKTMLVDASERSAGSNDVSDKQTRSVSVRESLLASTGSKVVAATLTYPLQLVRTRMQEVGASSSRYGDFASGTVRILRTEGVRGFYRGLGTNIARVMPQSAVTFVTYEQILRLCKYAHDQTGSPTS
jgi:solute carrier family 25 (mitochondrial folate transporter), member 32